MTEKLPIKLEKVSRKLWPRKIYVKIKETHPVLGSIFLTVWTILWTILAVLLNVIFVIIIVGTILIVLFVLFSDSSFDTVFVNLHLSTSKKKKENEDQ